MINISGKATTLDSQIAELTQRHDESSKDKRSKQLYFRENSKRLEVLALQKRADKQYKYVLLSHWYKDNCNMN